MQNLSGKLTLATALLVENAVAALAAADRVLRADLVLVVAF